MKRVAPAEATQIGHAEVMRLFLLAAIALPLLPDQPKDLNRESDADGFGNIKWGMTVAEAKAAFPGLHKPERSELTSGAFEERLIQPVLMIGSVEMTVSIQTKADSDLITRIVLKLAPYVQHRKTAFQFLSNNLIQKYGRPSRHDTAPRGRMKEETEVWALPSTTITLDWREESAGKFRLLDITYEATDKLLPPFPLAGLDLGRTQEGVRSIIRKDFGPIDLRPLVGVANIATSPDWQQSATRVVDIPITGSRPIK